MVKTFRIAIALACSALFGLPAQAGANIQAVQGPIKTAPDDQIFGASNVPNAAFAVSLAPYGYIEEEYFVSGTADAFKHTPTGTKPFETNLPYTTRIVIRRPADPRRFSGVVHFEPIHPTGGVTFTWAALSNYIMSRGDIYVAVGLGDASKGWSGSPKHPESTAPVGAHSVTKWFEPARYAALKWPDEEGIRFEVMGDIGVKLRSKDADNPLRDLNVRAMLVSGWSYTGSIQRTFINEGFHDRARLPDGRPAFDGYLVGVSSQWDEPGYLPLYNDEPYVKVGDPRRAFRKTDAKVIEFLTESEVELNLKHQPEAPDSDDKIGGHRLYELGGVIHVASLVDPTKNYTELPNLTQLAAHGYPQTMLPHDPVFACPLPQTDVPMGAYVRAAVDNLRHWILDGASPPHASPLVWNGKELQRDKTGNVVGGIRAAEFETPIARYGRYHGDDEPSCRADAPYPAVFFLRNDLSRDQLVARYGSAEGYIRRYDEQVDRLAKNHWLLPEDALRLKAKAVEQAHRLF
ncbi:MAG TPA: alpha/beta hydrolase domain-containing protein [Sphingomonadaceae bacterium]